MTRKTLCLIGILTLLLLEGRIDDAVGGSAADWQQRRLMQPTAAELNREQAGRIMIYDGLTDRQVATALDRHFNRIEAMMFTGIVITDKGGVPRTDPVSGELLVEEDGCD